MTKQEAIERLSTIFVHCDVDQCEDYSCDDCNETVRMAIEALAEPKWIPVSWHEITEEERVENDYPKNWDVLMDCEMPLDEQEILITTRFGTVEKNVCYVDDNMHYTENGLDWIDDIIAWMPLPEPYKESDGE